MFVVAMAFIVLGYAIAYYGLSGIRHYRSTDQTEGVVPGSKTGKDTYAPPFAVVLGKSPLSTQTLNDQNKSVSVASATPLFSSLSTTGGTTTGSASSPQTSGSSGPVMT